MEASLAFNDGCYDDYDHGSGKNIYYNPVQQAWNMTAEQTYYNSQSQVLVRGRLCLIYKKKFVLILQLHYAPLVPQIYQKILLSDPRWRTWFFEPRPFLPWEN